MFEFLTSGKETTDPLANPKTVAQWLRQLPALDVIGRQQHVMSAFEVMRKSRRPMDPMRVQAIQFLDAALGTDRRQLIKQYVENAETGPKLADRLWQAIYELAQGFMVAYHGALEEALSQPNNARWKSLVPLLFTRHTHYAGTDAKLRVFRYERWIPAKWADMHRAFLRATELGVDRIATSVQGAGQNQTPWTLEQEYLYVLLVHQLNTGNMTPGEIDWACSQLRAWSRRLALDAVPRSPEGFFVDIAGRTGLQRRTGNDSGSMLRYLDTSSLADQIDRAILSLRQAESTDQGPAGPINQQRIAILEKVRPSVAPNVLTDLRRDPRIACKVSARVRIGLARICREFGAKDVADAGADNGPTEQIEVYAVADAPRMKRPTPDEHDSLVASLSAFSDPMWQVKDRSVAGLRIAASGGIGQSLALGGLVAVRQSDVSDWVLGVVRRLNKVSNEEVEAGVSIVAERFVPVTLFTRREPRDDLGFVVNGIDVASMGARFDALYLPPPSRPDKPLAVKTLIVPTSEYSEGRSVILTTGRSVYTVAFRSLVEQRAEWSWAAIQILEKKARE
jgi:hypothetical protein